MNKPASLSRIRHQQKADKKRLLFAQALVASFRVIFRCLEFIGPPKRRQRMRQFREKILAIEHEREAILAQIKHGTVSQGLDALHEMSARHNRPEVHVKSSETHAYHLSVRQETEALQSIHKASDGDKTVAAQGYREYIAAHPTSHWGHRYLGDALRQIGDLDGSLKEYHEAIRLAGHDSIPGASSRLELGEVLSQKGDKEAAIAEFRGVIEEATPKTKSVVCVAFLRLGIVLNDIGEGKEARAAWKQAIEWDSTKIIAKRAQEMLEANP